MFMLQENQEAPEASSLKTKKTAKKTVKSKEKAAQKKAVKAKVAQKKVAKAPLKKAVSPKKLKPKAYKVTGAFKLDADGNVVKKTKSVNAVAVSKKEIVVSFIVKRK